MYEEFTKYPAGAIAHKYIDDVLDGTIIACEFVKRACRRHLDDLKKGKKRGLYFDPVAGQKVIDFKQLLKHSKGKWRRQLLILEPWQIFINWCVFGWMNDDGTRRFNKMYLEVARKNGKSTEVASTGLYGLGFDGEGGAEIYSVATKEDQAKIVWLEGQRMCRQSGFLGGIAGFNKKSTFIEATDSFWRPLGKDSKYQDGLHTHMGLIDEYHAHADATMYDVINSSMGSRMNPLLVIITTAGFNKHSACHDERDYVVSILRGEYENDAYFGIIFTLDKDDDWKDEKVWIKSNPNLGISVRLKDMQTACLEAQQQSSKKNNFLVKRLNIWTSQVTAFLDMEKWDRCDDKFDEADMLGRPCFLSLDLASKNDIAAMVATFRLENGKLAAIAKFYCPKERIERRERKDRATYQAWVEQGYLTATEGNRIDYDVIKADIMKFNQLFEIQKLGFDKWNFEYLYQRLVKEGIDPEICFEYGQTLKYLSEPTKELEVLVAEERLVHNGNPILHWMAGNAAIYVDPNENIRIIKNIGGGKVDGIACIVMDIGMEMGDNEDDESVYETRDILVF